MKRKSIIYIIGMILTTGVIVLNSGIYAKAAYSKANEIKAFGTYKYDYDQSGVYGDHPSDVIYDAEDVYYLYQLCR